MQVLSDLLGACGSTPEYPGSFERAWRRVDAAREGCSRSGPLADLAVMDDMTREAAEGLDDWLERIDQAVASISDDEIQARLQWTLALHRISIQSTHE